MSQQFGSSIVELIISLCLISLFFASLNNIQLPHAKSAAIIHESIGRAQVNYFLNRIFLIEDEDYLNEIKSFNEMNQEVLPNGHANFNLKGNKKEISLNYGQGNFKQNIKVEI